MLLHGRCYSFRPSSQLGRATRSCRHRRWHDVSFRDTSRPTYWLLLDMVSLHWCCRDQHVTSPALTSCPDPQYCKAGARRRCQGLAVAPTFPRPLRLPGQPWQLRARRQARCGRNDDQRGTRVRARVSIAPRPCIRWVKGDPNHDAVMPAGGEAPRRADPFLFLGTKATGLAGTPPPRTVIGDPSQRADWAETVHYLQQPPFIAPGADRCHLAPRPLTPAATSLFVARRRGVARLGELLRRRHRLNSVPGDRQLHRCAVAPVVVLQAQGHATRRAGLIHSRTLTGTSGSCVWPRLDKAMRLGDCPSRIAASSWRRQNSPFGLLALIWFNASTYWHQQVERK